MHRCSTTQAASSKRAPVARGPSARRPVRCHAAAVDSCKEAKTQLRDKLRGVQDQLYMVPAAQREELHGLIKCMEDANPTHDPRNCQDKLAGCWMLLYTSRALSKDTESALVGLRPLRVYITIDIWQNGIVKSIEFTEDGKHALPGSLNVGADFEWASSSRLDLAPKGAAVSADDLRQRLPEDHSVLSGAFSPQGQMKITFEDDGVFVSRDESDVYVFEHRITRVHA